MKIYDPTLQTPSLNSAGAYQVSGIPFFKGGLTATNTVQVIEFPSVTNWIYFANVDETLADDLKVGFSEDGINGKNYFIIGSSNFNYAPYEAFPWKVTKIYYKRVSGDVTFDIAAGLTGIVTGSILNNWAGSIGV